MTASLLCSATHSRLLVIDIQTRLAAAMPDADRARVLRNTTLLLQAAALLAVPTCVSEQYPKGLGTTEDELTQHLPVNTQRIEKTCFAACDANSFSLDHSAETQYVLAGMEAHVCILQTALQLHAQGRTVFVVEDAVCARQPASTANALARLRQTGVIVTNTESVIFEWLRDAHHEHFKTLSALLR